LPIGINFPNIFDKRHPVQLYFAILFLLLFIFLSWVEKRYRFFEWYKAGKYSAQSGFIVGVTVMGYGLIHLVLTPLHAQELVIMSIRLDIFLHILLLFVGFFILYVRSGKSNFGKKKWGVTKGQEKTAKKLFTVSRFQKRLMRKE